MKYVQIIIVIVLLLAGGVIVLFNQNTGIDTSDKFHKDIFEQAVETWNSKLAAGPFQPVEVNGEQVGSSSRILLNWEKPEQTYNHFLLTISDPASDWSRTESGEHDRVSLDLDTLAPYTEYVIVLQACLDPTCQTWYVSEQEVWSTTRRMYWQLQGEGSWDTYVPATEEATQPQDESEELPMLTANNSIFLWPDNSQFSKEDVSLHLEGILAPNAPATLLNP